MTCVLEKKIFKRDIPTAAALKGLLVAIQLSNYLKINLECQSEDEEYFKDVLPVIITAAVKAGSSLEIYDEDKENLNEFAVD